MIQSKEVTFADDATLDQQPTDRETIDPQDYQHILATKVRIFGLARLTNNWLEVVFPEGYDQIASFCRLRGIGYKLNGYGCLFLRQGDKK